MVNIIPTALEGVKCDYFWYCVISLWRKDSHSMQYFSDVYKSWNSSVRQCPDL